MMTFEWSLTLGNLLHLAGLVAVIVTAWIKLSGRLDQIEVKLGLLWDAWRGQDGVPIDARVSVLEHDLGDTRGRLSDAQHDLNNLRQACMARHLTKGRP